MSDRRHCFVAVASLVAVLAGVAGCDLIAEKIRETETKPPAGGGPGAPGTPGVPGAPATPGSPPVVTPPTAPPPPPMACASSAGCPAGQRCSTERGACERPPGCGMSAACPAVCYGSCEGVPRPDEPLVCNVDADCRLFSDYCTGCDCRALGKGQKDPTCSGPGVRCFADPCQRQVAVCERGRCAVRGSKPVPPPPSRACISGVEGDANTCVSRGDWKERAYRLCQAQRLELTDYSPFTECGKDSFRNVKYECCTPAPSPPPPPTRCIGAGEGSETTCRTTSDWKLLADRACRAQGLQLQNYWPAGECGPDSFRYVKYECCGSLSQPPVTPPPPATPPAQKCSSNADCPLIRAACQRCPDGSASCPSSRCEQGICQVSWPACAGVPTPPAMPWDPCGGKKCGEPCTLCPPGAVNCAETKDLKACNLDGKCASGGVTCTRS